MQRSILFLFLWFLSNALWAQLTPSAQIIEKGISLFDEGKYNEAIELFKLVNENDSNYTYTVAEMGLCYLQLEKYDSAIYYVDKGLVEPSSSRSHLLGTKGTAYDYLGQTEKAIEIYKEAIGLFPYKYLLHYNLGVTYLKNNDFINAVACFQEAIRCNPFHASSHFNIQRVYSRQAFPVNVQVTLKNQFTNFF